MTELTVALLDESVNNVVLRVPGRQFPGVLIPGDALKILADITSDLVEAANAGKLDDVQSLSGELDALIRVRVDAYERAMLRSGLKLPYSTGE